MISNTVNKTSLHPGGVEPHREHTELEEELHEKAHIDYDRVAIVSPLSHQLAAWPATST
jgi:phosphoenolpyruvate carboxykinase (ATP)